MAYFFSDVELELGKLDADGNFEAFDYLTEFGQLTTRVTLTHGSDYSYYDEDVAIVGHRFNFEYKKPDNTWSTFNNASSTENVVNWTIHSWQLHGLYSGQSRSFTHNYAGSQMEIGKFLGTLRNEARLVRARMRTIKKDINHQQDFWDFSAGTIGQTPTGWTGNGLRKVYNGSNNAMALVGTATSVANTENPPSDSGNFRVAKIDKTYGAFRDMQVNFNATYVASGGTYNSGGTTSNLTNPPEFADGEHLFVQYKIGSGNWNTGRIITVNTVTANTLTSFKMRIHQTTETTEDVQIRFVSKTKTANSSTNDVWLIDSVKVLTTKETVSNANEVAGHWLTNTYLYSNELTAPPLWEWDESYTDVYWVNDNALLPAYLTDNNDTDPYFELYEGEIRQARVVLGAKGVEKTWSVTTGGPLSPITNFFEIARAAKFEIKIQNWNPSTIIPAVGAKSKTLSLENGYFLLSSYSEDGWRQSNSKQRVEMDLTSYFTIKDFWESQTIYAYLRAYGIDASGNHYLVDEYSFSSTNQVHDFIVRDDENPWDYVTFTNPGTDSSLIGINDIRIKTSTSSHSAYDFFAGVWRFGDGTNFTWNTQKSGSQFVSSQTILDGFGDDGYLRTGSQLIKPGTIWFQPYPEDFNYYGAADEQGTTDTGLDVYVTAYKKNITGYSTSDRIDYRIVSVIPTLRKGWKFLHGTNAVKAIQTGDMGGQYLTHDNVSTWTLSKIKINAVSSTSKAHWFDVSFAYSRNGGTDWALGATKRFTGSMSTLAFNSEIGAGYAVQLNNPISDADLNTYFPSIYDNEQYQLSITVAALNNLGGVIDVVSKTIDVSAKGREAADLLNTSSIVFSSQSNTRSTKHAPYLYATYRIGATSGSGASSVYTGKAAYVRLDVYDENDNFLAAFFNTGFENNQNNNKTSGWIKATDFSDYQTKVANNTATDYIRLSNGLHTTSYVNKNFKFTFVILADDGGAIDYEATTKEFTAFSAPNITAITPTSNHSATTDCKVIVAEAAGTRYDYATIEFKNTGTDATVTYTSKTNGTGHYYASSATNRSFTVDENNSNLSIASIINDGGWTNTPIECTVSIFAYGFDYNNDEAGVVDVLSNTFNHQAFTYIFNSVTLSTDKNTHSEYDLKFQWSAGDKDFHKAGRFRIRLRDSSGTTYASTSADLRKEFYVAGSSGTTGTITRNVDLNAAKLNIADMLNNSNTSRYSSHTIAYEIQAQRQDGDIWVNIPYAYASGTFARQALQWNHKTTSTSVTIHSDTYNETKLKIRVYRNSSADTIPLIRFGIEAHEYMPGTGTVPHNQWQYEYFTTTVLNTEGNSLYEDFYYTIPSALDRTRIKQFLYDVRGGYGTSSDFTAVGNTKAAYINASTGWKPYWVFSGSTALSLGTNTIADKFVDVNIRGAYASSSDWRTPSKFGLTFKKLNSTGTNIIHSESERELLFSSSDANTNDTIGYRIKSFYDGASDARSRATEEHYFQVLIKSYDASNNVMQQMTRNFIMPVDPSITTTIKTATGCILADNGTEHLYLRFQNTNIPDDFKQSGHDYNLNVKIKDGENIIVDYNVSIDSSDIGNNYNVTVPTGVNVNTQETTSGVYTISASASYYLDYNNSQVITGNTHTNSDQAYKIYHTFPKAEHFENLGHTYEGTDGKLLFSFGKRNNGVQTGYSNQHGGFNFDISATETVTGALAFDKLTPNPPSPLPSHTVSGITDVTQIENGIPWTSYYQYEANYKSTLTVSIQEKYDNTNQTWASVATGHVSSSLDKQNYNTSAPTFSSNVSLDTKVFTSPDTTMNDLSNYPNTTVVPTNIVVTDIPGEYAAPYKRFTFSVPIDFEQYFTNAEPFFSFGLEVEYKDSSNNTHTSGPSYITDQGNLVKASEFSGLGAEKIAQMQESSVYKVRDFGQEDGQYYFDLVFNPDGFDYAAQPNFNHTNRRHAQYTLLVYIRDEVQVFGQDEKIFTEPIAYSDIGNWSKSPVADPDDWYADGTIKLWEPVYSNFNVQPQTNDKTKFDYSFGFDIDDIKKKPYAYSQMEPRWRGVVKTLGGAMIGTYFLINGSYHYEGGEIAQTTYSFSMSSRLNRTNFNPFEDITFSFTPYLGMYTRIKNSYLFGIVDTIPELDIQHTLNYRDLIVPSFDEFSVDSSLNEDTINNSNTSFTNKVVWFYNKTALKDVTKVHTISEEWIVIRRKIRQGEQVFDGGHEQAIPLYGASVVRTNHDADTFKFTYTDSNVDLQPYSGLNGDKAFVFEYELTPAFRYGVSSETATMTEIPEKKISTFLIPDEFPYANNGITGLASNSIHEDKHSIHLKWNHQYTESVDTFRNIGAKIHFDLYWYVEETDSQKTVKEELRPKRRKLEALSSNWNFIDTVDYVYPSSPVTNGNYKFSYLWKYDKLETDAKMIVAVLTRIESDIVGVLSQNIGTVGNNSIELGTVKTSDKARKNKLRNDDELKRTPNKIVKRKEEFNTSLEQLPISTTRKKAKPRGSDKPYSSST